MGAFDKFFGMLKMDDEDFEDDIYEEAPSEKVVFPPTKSDDMVEEDKQKRISPKSNPNKSRRGYSNMEVVNVKPTSVEDGRRITDLLLENKVVFLDLEGIDMNMAQRIIDFVSGASYAIDGTLQPMSRYTFVIAPPAVNVSGDINDGPSNGNNQVAF